MIKRSATSLRLDRQQARINKLKQALDRQQSQINKLKQALAACIDVCATQNRQLGLVAEAASAGRFPIERWNVLSDATKENGELADKLLRET